MKKILNNRIVIGALVMCGLWTLIALSGVAPKAHAQVYNPHPTPPADSITTAMLKDSIVFDKNVAATSSIQLSKIGTHNDSGLVLFGGYNNIATSSFFEYSTSTNKMIVDSINLANGQLCYGALCYELPATDGQSGDTLSTNGSATLSWQSGSSNQVVQDIIMDTAVSAGQTVAYDIPADATTSASGSSSGTALWDWHVHDYAAQKFTTGAITSEIKSITVSYYVNVVLSGSSNAYVGIEADSAGVPSGTFIASTTCNLSAPPYGTESCTAYFPSGISVSPSTNYWFVIKSSNMTSVDSPYGPNGCNSGCTTAYYSDNGTTWTSGGNTTMYGFGHTDGSASHGTLASDASNTSNLYTQYLGIANNTVGVGGNAHVVVSGTMASSSLTIGKYYLSDTDGEISTSAGSNSRVVGWAVSTSTLLVSPQAP